MLLRLMRSAESQISTLKDFNRHPEEWIKNALSNTPSPHPLNFLNQHATKGFACEHPVLVALIVHNVPEYEFHTGDRSGD